MKPRAGRASDRYIIGPRLFVLLLKQQGLHVGAGFWAVEYDEAIHHRAPMPCKGDADTNQVKVGGLFRLPRSLTDAGYGSAVAVFWTTPGRFHDPEEEAPCERAPAHSMLAKNSRVCAGDFPSAYNGTRGKHHVQTHKTACQDAPIAQAANAATAGRGLGRWRHLFIARTTLN